MYDIIIIGAGPAGLTAALYARRADKSVIVIEKSTFGGQITHSPKVENFPCFLTVSGTELADKLVDQVLTQGAEIELDRVTGIENNDGIFTVKCENGQFEGKSVIIATGSNHRQLGLPKETDFIGEGISYCAVCDGPFYKDKKIAVIGGGNTALQETVMLSEICKSVTVIQNLDFLTAEGQLINAISSKDNVDVILSSVVTAIIGDKEFEGIEIETNGEKNILNFDAIFVAIGQKPENESFSDAVKLDERGYITADEGCIPDGYEGIFVAGDCRSKSVRQIATAISDGAAASVAACKYLG